MTLEKVLRSSKGPQRIETDRLFRVRPIVTVQTDNCRQRHRTAWMSFWSPKMLRACPATARAATCMTQGMSSPAILYLSSKSWGPPRAVLFEASCEDGPSVSLIVAPFSQEPSTSQHTRMQAWTAEVRADFVLVWNNLLLPGTNLWYDCATLNLRIRRQYKPGLRWPHCKRTWRTANSVTRNSKILHSSAKESPKSQQLADTSYQ